MNANCRLTQDDWRVLADVLHLTPREVDIVRSLLEGQSETGVGRVLGISTNTVHTHLGRIYKKLEVRSVAGLVRCVFSNYLQLAQRPASQNITMSVEVK